MLVTSVPTKPFFHRNFGAFFLYIAFILGFLSGDAIATSGISYFMPLIRSAAPTQSSITSLLATVVFTFSITALIFAVEKTSFLLALCFAQAVIFGIVSTSVYHTFGYTQWLIRTLLLFAGTVNLVCLLWLWSRNISNRTQNTNRDFLLSFCVSMIAAVLDYYWISPLLASLLFN